MTSTVMANKTSLRRSPAAFSILYGKGDGTLNAAVTQSATFTSFTVGDFNGDGVTDIALLLVPPTGTSLFTSVQILLGSTTGTFSQGVSLGVTAPATPSVHQDTDGGDCSYQ